MKNSSCPEIIDPDARPERGIYPAVPKGPDNTSEEISSKPESPKEQSSLPSGVTQDQEVKTVEPIDWDEYMSKRPKKVNIPRSVFEASMKFAERLVRRGRMTTGECLCPDSSQLDSGLELDPDGWQGAS